eukprot:scaffold6285_cov121-Isochrysis_galbana.AAC.7
MMNRSSADKQPRAFAAPQAFRIHRRRQRSARLSRSTDNRHVLRTDTCWWCWASPNQPWTIRACRHAGIPGVERSAGSSRKVCAYRDRIADWFPTGSRRGSTLQSASPCAAPRPHEPCGRTPGSDRAPPILLCGCLGPGMDPLAVVAEQCRHCTPVRLMHHIHMLAVECSRRIG